MMTMRMRMACRFRAYWGGLKLFDAANMPEEETAQSYSAAADLELQASQAVTAVATHPVKRLFDILGAGFGLLLFLPLLAIVMLAIRLESPGPAIFRQRRTGYRGRVFTILKFRTMTVTEDGGQIRHATKGDARVTAIG